jgi:hypothetical protein
MRIAALSILIILLAPVLFAQGYEISKARVDYYLLGDGSVNVTEQVTYILDGSFTELYLSKPGDLNITGFSGSCDPGTCTFYSQAAGSRQEHIVTRQFRYETVTAKFNYLLGGEVLAQKDTAQFFYKLWGD